MTATQAIEQLKRPNGGIDPQIQLAATEVVLAAKAAGHEIRSISWFNPASTPEHHVPGMAGQKGVAVDFMCDRATGDFIADYLWQHRARLGLCWEIWRDRIRSTSPGKPGTWQNRGKGDHYDHVHGNFGHLVGTSGQGKVTKITYKPLTGVQPSAGTVWLDRLVPGVTDSDSVRAVQRALGIQQTGSYDLATVAAVKAYQAKLGDTVRDGLLGPKQTARLFADAGLAVVIRTDPSGQAPTKPHPEPEEPKPVTATISVVDANVLRPTDPAAGKTRLKWTQRLPGIIAALKAASPDLVLVQELTKNKTWDTAADIAKHLGSGWAYDRCNGIGIFWRQAVLERTGDAVYHLYSDRDNRYMSSVPLRHKASGIEFWADVSHFENDGDPATDGHAARRLQAREMAARTQSGRRVFGADLNSTTRAGASATAREREKPRPILKAGGWDWFLTDKGVSSLESHWGGRASDKVTKGPWIDDIGGRNVTFVSGRLLRTDSSRASDHHFLQATIRL